MGGFYARAGAAFVANATRTGSQSGARTAKLASGEFVIVWTDASATGGDTAGTAVRAQLFAADGTPLGAERLVNSATASDQKDASVAALTGGGFVVVWQDSSLQGGDSSSSGIKAQLYDASGARSGSEFRVNTTVTGAQTEPRATGLAGGGFVLLWSDSDVLRGQVYTAGGTPAGTEFRILAGGRDASIVALAGGGFAVAFTSTTGDGSGYAARAQLFDAAGAPLAPVFVLNDVASGNQWQTALAPLADGGFIAVWLDSGFGSAGRIIGQRFHADGSANGGEFSAYQPGVGQFGAIDPTVAALSDGGFAVGWRAAGPEVQVFDSAGAKVGRAFSLAATGEQPAIEALGGGGFLVAWHSASDIQAQIVMPTEGAVTSLSLSNTAVSETLPGGLFVGSVSASYTALNSSVSYSLLDDWGGTFRLEGDRLVLADADALDFESGTVPAVTLRATDGAGNFLDRTVSLTVTDEVRESRWSAGEPLVPSSADWGPGFPVIAPLASGGFVLVYWDSRYSAKSAVEHPLRGQIYSASGEKVGAEFQVPVVKDDNLHRYTVEGLPNGGFVIAFGQGSYPGTEEPGDNTWVQRFDAAGTAVGPATQANTRTPGHQHLPEIAVLEGGAFVVAWTDMNGNWPAQTGGVKGQLFTADGLKSGGEFLIPPTVVLSQDEQALAALPGGGFIAIWVEDTSSGTAIRAQKFDAQAGRDGAAFDILRTTSPYVFDPEIAILEDGGFVVTWASSNGFSDERRTSSIVGQRFDSAGAASSGPFTISTETAGARQGAKVTPLQDGGFVVTWNDAIGDGSGSSVRARFFDSTGATVGSEFTVNSGVAEDQRNPVAAALPWGGFAVAWDDHGGATPGNTSTVVARIFSPAGIDAADDSAATDEASVVVGNVFANSGHGADAVPASATLWVSEVDGSSAAVGREIALASGAKLTLNRDGSFSYDPSGAFDGLADSSTGGSNARATDSFTYTLAGGDTATVTVAVSGLWSMYHRVEGTPGDDRLTGTDKDDIFAPSAGNDWISAGGGEDWIEGGVGNDTLEGGDGHDRLEDNSGSDVLRGGAGNDQFYFSRGSGAAERIEVDGGEGVDTVYYHSQNGLAHLAADLGAGNDRATLYTVAGSATISFGGGSDVLEISQTAFLDGTVVVVDFDPGASDRIEWSAFIGARLSDWDGSTNPFATGHLRLLQTGSDVLLQIDWNGGGNGFATLVTFRNVDAGAFTALTLDGYSPDGSAPQGATFTGSADWDTLEGTAGGDLFFLQAGGVDEARGGAGQDGFFFGAALTLHDRVDGGAGRDYIALQGDYPALTLGWDLVRWELMTLLSGSDTRFGLSGADRFSYNITTVNENATAAGGIVVVDAGQLLEGENLTFDASAETDGSYRVWGGFGIDTLKGGAASDYFYFYGGRFGASDTIDGGTGARNQLQFFGALTAVFGADQIANIQSIVLLSGRDLRANTDFDYDLTMHDNNLASGVRMTVDGGQLQASEHFVFDGSAETDGTFRIFGGAGDDTLRGGQGADTIIGAAGKDSLRGEGGADLFAYRGVSDSTSTGFDTIHGFVFGTDTIDLTGTHDAYEAKTGGTLRAESFDADLAAAMAGTLDVAEAVLFTADQGDMAGRLFLIVDENGVAGYQAGQDYVIELAGTAPPAGPVPDFIV